MKPIKPKKRHLVILIVTKNSPYKLKNLLDSISDNSFLAKSNICIIDNSDVEEDIIKTQEIINHIKDNKILLINKNNWMRIKRILLKEIKFKRYKSILKDVVLGVKYWNIHNTRNIGQIMCSLFYKDDSIVLSLDSDMVIPKKFCFSESQIKSPIGIVLRGCPDLSRLEWIRLYSRYIAKLQYNKNPKNDGEYASLLIKNLNKSDIKYILSKYSTLLNDETTIDKKMSLPLREELNNGGYLTSLDNVTRVMYPIWFDSDWFCFQRLRKYRYYPVRFINSEIIHDSFRKDPLDKELLIFEEVGKIITTVLKNKSSDYIPNKNELLKEIERREKLIIREIQLLRDLKLNLNDNVNIKKILQIISLLLELIKSIKSISPTDLIDQIKQYESKEEYWNSFLNFLKNSINIKRKIYRKLNYENIIIFSPHCDDVIFSLGGAIYEGRLTNLEIYNFYTKSNYQMEGKKQEDITKVRCLEEHKALDKFGVPLTFLGYNDATRREYSSEEHYMSPENNPRKDSSFLSVQEKIREIVKKNKAIIFLFPLGLGYNVDHVILFEIGKELDKEGYPVLFYEDIGYDMSRRDLLIKKYLKKRKLSLMSRTLKVNDILGKLNCMRIYKTQISKEILTDIKNIIKKRGGERLWGKEKNFVILDL
ncbi:MAG: PIG-L family deacetylase [Nanoarchaeota archaeon]